MIINSVKLEAVYISIVKAPRSLYASDGGDAPSAHLEAYLSSDDFTILHNTTQRPKLLVNVLGRDIINRL